MTTTHEYRWIRRTVIEQQDFLVCVPKGAEAGVILQAAREGDALFGTPQDTTTETTDLQIVAADDGDEDVFRAIELDLPAAS